MPELSSQGSLSLHRGEAVVLSLLKLGTAACRCRCKLAVNPACEAKGPMVKGGGL